LEDPENWIKKFWYFLVRGLDFLKPNIYIIQV